MNISIIGLGWLGLPLAVSLKNKNHHVLGTTRSMDKIESLKQKGIGAFLLDPTLTPDSSLLAADYCILNIPPFKEELDWFKRWNWHKKTKLIFISSTSVISQKESGKILSAQEAWVKDFFLHWNILRPSGLIGYDRHPGRFLSGKKNLEGKNRPVNLIHRDDVIGVIETVIEKNLDHLVLDVTSDEKRTRKEFYQGYCLRNHLPLPEFKEDDLTSAEGISNSELKKYYELKFPTIP